MDKPDRAVVYPSEFERVQIVWCVFRWADGKLDSIYEDHDEAREFIRNKPHLRGESWALIRRVKTGLSNAALNELAGHEEDAQS